MTSVHGGETVLAIAFFGLRSKRRDFPAAAFLSVVTVPFRSIPSFHEFFRLRLVVRERVHVVSFNFLLN